MYPPGFDVAAVRVAAARKKKAEAATALKMKAEALPATYKPRFTIIDLPAAPEHEEEEMKPDVSSLMPTSLPLTSLNKKERTRKEVNPYCLDSVVN